MNDPEQELIEEAVEALKVQGIAVTTDTVKSYVLGQKRAIEKAKAYVEEASR